MDCIVICGGQGTRVREITKDEIPKILIEINGKPFVEYLINTLYSQGVRRIVFAAGFRGDKLKEYLERRKIMSNCIPWPRMSVEIEDRPLDTGGAVLNILNKSGYAIHSNPFLVVNGDSLIVPGRGVDSYEDLYYHQHGKPDCVMFTCKIEHNGEYGSLGVYYPPAIYGPLIHSFESGKAGKTWINCGWYILRHEFFDSYKNPICNRDKIQIYDVEKMSLEKELFPKYLEEGGVITPVIIDKGQFIEIGTPKALGDAARRLKKE